VPFEKSRATEFWLRVEQSALTVWEKSADGILAGANEMARVLPAGQSLQVPHPGEGPNGARPEWDG